MSFTETGVCGSLSPDGKVGCTLLAGHQLDRSYPISQGELTADGIVVRSEAQETLTMIGQPMCKNTLTGQEWCGSCGTWSCKQHEIRGQDQARVRLTRAEALDAAQAELEKALDAAWAKFRQALAAIAQAQQEGET